MTKPKIINVTYSNEMQEESVILLFRLIERLVLEALPTDPHMIGLFLEGSMDNFKNN